MKKLILLLLVLTLLLMPVLVNAQNESQQPEFNHTGNGENMNRHPIPPGWAETDPPGPIGPAPDDPYP